MTRRVDSRRATYGFYGVAANGLTISVCMLCMIVCMSNSGGIVGGGGTSKYNVSLIF